jgi:hypothetical protein
MKTEAVEAPEQTTAQKPITLLDTIVEKLRMLPPEKQMEVRDFVEFLIHKNTPPRPGQSLMGALAHLGIKVSREDIAEARREMWGGHSGE